MFVRFRQTEYRFALSVVETRWLNGKVKHEHVARLGSIETPLTVACRVAFWARLHKRLAKLDNRVDQGRIMGSVHERIPMPTVEEKRELAIENAKAQENVSIMWRNFHASMTEPHKALLASVSKALEAS